MLSGFIKKLLFAREFMIADGRIEVLGERETMFPVALLGRLQDENPKKTYSIAKDVLKEEIDRFTKKIGNSKAEMIVALKDIFEATGFGNLEVADLDMIKKRAIVRVHDNPIAIVHAAEKKNTPCTIVAGVLAGIFSSLFDQDSEAEEKACVLKGNICCEFVIKANE